MPKYKRPAQFPSPFIPGADEVGIKDPFGATIRSPGTGGPQMAGGGGTTVTGGVTIELARELIDLKLPAHPWQIVITNVYDYTDPDVPVFVSASAVIQPGSVVYQVFSNFTSLHTVTGVGSSYTPINGQFLYLAGVVNASLNITSITLTQASSLPARMVFVSNVQSDFIVPIGKFIARADGSFIAEQWVNNQLTSNILCTLNAGITVQARYLI